MFEVISLVVLVKSFVEFSEDVGNSFSRCDAFSFVVLYFKKKQKSNLRPWGAEKYTL